MRTEILYEDKSIMVVRKPAGLAVQSAGIGQPDVVSELKSYLAKLPGGQKLSAEGSSLSHEELFQMSLIIIEISAVSIFIDL